MDQVPKMVQRGFKKKKEVQFSDEVTFPADEATQIKQDYFETASVSDGNDGPINMVSKTPKSKKARRAPNAFLLFAKEHRKNIPRDSKSPGYVSRVLGSMWKDMAIEEKDQYILEARRLGALHKMNSTGYLESPSETVKLKKCKSEDKRKPIKKKLLKKNRKPTIKKILRSSSSPAPESSKSNLIHKKREETVSVTKESAVEAAENFAEPKGESKPTIDYHFHACNSPAPVASSSSAPEHSCRCHHVSYQRPMDRCADVVQPPMFSAGINMPYFGAGLSQSLFPQNPLADISFWMYRQSFMQYPYNFQPPALSNPYSSFAYPPYAPYSSLYSNSYVPDRCCGHLSSTQKPSCSAAAATANTTNISAANMINVPTTGISHATTSLSHSTTNLSHGTTTTMTHATTTSMAQADEESQDVQVELDSTTMLIVDDEEPKVPEGYC